MVLYPPRAGRTLSVLSRISYTHDRAMLTKTTVESIGYIGRAMSAHESPNRANGPYVMKSTLLIVPEMKLFIRNPAVLAS